MSKTHSVLISISFILGACGSHDDVPAEFAGMTTPLDASDPATQAAGESLYNENCVDCHGNSLRGDGPLAASFDPPPTGSIEHAAHHEDDYLLWRITDGLGDMPAFAQLPTDSRWQLISFVRSRLP